MKIFICGMLLAFSVAADGAALPTIEQDADRETREWNFRVYLDDAEIGYHNFSLLEMGDTRKLATEAEFRVKFLFFTAYQYAHVNQENWRDDCLQQISSSTDANGHKFEVQGVKTFDSLSVASNDSRREHSGCVMTFAYWNPDILGETQLLNSQTGEVLPVQIELVAREKLRVRGEEISAQRYRLIAKNMELDIWYSDDEQWLALESTVKGGRKLRYELT